MKIAVVWTGRELVEKAAYGCNAFLQSFKGPNHETEAWYLGDKKEALELVKRGMEGLEKVWTLDFGIEETGYPEVRLDALLALYNERQPELVVFAGSENSLAVRFAYRIGAVSLTDCIKVEYGTDGFRVFRRVYNANLDGLYKVKKGPLVLTVSKIGPTAEPTQKKAVLKTMRMPFSPKAYGYCLERCITDVGDKNLLEEANLVFIGGRGMGSKENYERLKAVALSLGGACGCTRAAATSGFASAKNIVGQSGKVLGAEICIAFGVSGAGPFMAGVENVSILTAINTDSKAPIFARADYGMVEDIFKVLEILEQIAKERSQ